MRDDPKLIVATNINPKMVGGCLFLNATSGTHVENLSSIVIAFSTAHSEYFTSHSENNQHIYKPWRHIG
ncbi:hypothetical protein Bca52824_007289 [Brassica carinata]|uniref:Uncharacterized protein n=1 Tax=Brassica carinata TaxID=52824 RepID=A0A8X7W6S7_BRACI|nr:hypothetical protein Bca52824_007289 [Brassica carinata]